MANGVLNSHEMERNCQTDLLYLYIVVIDIKIELSEYMKEICMVTLKDIAQYTQLSPSTVSIVLKGNGDARKIKKETQRTVLDAAKKLGYKPNVQARVLRGGSSNRMVITLFWASDIRIHMLSRFINGLQECLVQNNYPCDLQIKPYENNRLNEALNNQAILASNGMIICNPSETDMEFLESLDAGVPIVLYNRYSDKYATINMDDHTIGELPAHIFARHRKTKPAVLKSPATFNGMNIRTDIFAFTAAETGMNLPVSIQIPDSMEGGYKGALQLCSGDFLPDCLFCTSDSIALGALKAFHEKGIRIPKDIEIISVGNGNPDQEEYAIPSLSVISLPMEAMAAACLRTVYTFLSGGDYKAGTSGFPIHYVARESCPE